ncbi:MAG TPA: hypothetical protein VHJ39_00055 [Solirubrobacteraceae bacterium]|jgi:hypothetical protein|nr:hypothetical protein [Solirubrobacteraceae bacterium]
MRRRKPQPEPPGHHADRLGQIRSHVHDEDDDRPSREDRAPQTSQLFNGPVPLPRVLQPRKKR